MDNMNPMNQRPIQPANPQGQVPMQDPNQMQARSRQVERYDTIRAIDELIDIVRDASGVPFSEKCSVDRTEMIARLEELKARLPMAVSQSNDIVKRAQDIIGTAREKGKKVLNDADRMYAMKVSEHEITLGAKQQAAQIIEEANAQSEELRKSAHKYVKDLLTRVNNTLSESVAKVQNNLAEIDTTIE